MGASVRGLRSWIHGTYGKYGTAVRLERLALRRRRLAPRCAEVDQSRGSARRREDRPPRVPPACAARAACASTRRGRAHEQRENGVDRARRRADVFLVLLRGRRSERTTRARASRARSSFGASAGPAASCRRANVSGPSDAKAPGVRAGWFGAQRASSSSSSIVSAGRDRDRTTCASAPRTHYVSERLHAPDSRPGPVCTAHGGTRIRNIGGGGQDSRGGACRARAGDRRRSSGSRTSRRASATTSCSTAIDLTVNDGRGARRHRAEREREEHAVALREPARADRQRPDLLRGRGDHPQGCEGGRASAADRHRLPAVQSLSAPARDRQPHARGAPRQRTSPARRPSNAPTSCSSVSASWTRHAATRISSPVDSSNASRSLAH